MEVTEVALLQYDLLAMELISSVFQDGGNEGFQHPNGIAFG